MNLVENLTQIFTNQASSQPLGFFIALLTSFIITPLIKNRALELGLTKASQRNEKDRPIHKDTKTNIPRLGGLAIFISLLLTIIFYLAFFGRYTPSGFTHLQLEGIVFGAVIIFFIGLLDDIKPLHPLVKLAGQIIAASAAWLMDVRIHILANPLFYFDSSFPPIELDNLSSFIITVIFLVIISNAVNLIDGIDGLAVGVCLIASIAAWAINISPILNQPAAAILAASLAGACLGFLRYNFNPARIFLGDSGAYLLGFTIACIACIGLVKKVTVIVLSPLFVLVFLVPLFDISYAVIRRVCTKRSIVKPDLGHIHYRLLELGLSEKQVTFLLYAVTLLGGLIGTFMLSNEIAFDYLFICAFICLIWLFFSLVINLKNQKIGRNK